MQTIVTKYHGPTNTKGSRVSAESTEGTRIFVPFDGSLDVDQNHALAVKELREMLKWNGSMVGGQLNDSSMVWVFTKDSPTI